MAEVPELSQRSVNERSVDPTPTNLEAEFAFLVVKTAEGQFVVVPDINAPVTVERQASFPEIKGALSVVLNDVNNQETAQLTVMFQQMRAQQLMDQHLNQQILNKTQQTPPGMAG